MSTVSRITSGASIAPTNAGRSVSGGFRLPQVGPSEKTESTAASAAVAGTTSLLSVQLANDAWETDRRAKREGEMALLDLQALQVAMLEGQDLAPLLSRLEAVAITRPTDAALHAIITEIRLRVAVEAAKVKAGRYSAPRR